MEVTSKPQVRERSTAAPTRASAPPPPAPAAPAPQAVKDTSTLSREAVAAQLGNQGQQLVLGAAEGVLNKNEFLALANQRQQAAEMANQLNAGTLTNEQREQLQANLTSFDQTLAEYRGGDFAPAIPKDATFQNPKQVLDSMGYAEGAEAMRNMPRAWTDEEKVQYRLYTSADVSLPDPKAPGAQGGGDPLPAHPVLGEAMQRNLPAWDKDGNGSLSPKELETAMENPNLKGDDATALMIMRRNQAGLGGLTPDGAGISTQDVTGFNGATTANPTIQKTSMEFEITRRQELAPTGPLAGESFDPMQIKQGSDGTCILLTSMAGQDPAALKKMVTDNGDGTYTVNFADGRSSTVPEPTEAQRRYHSQGPNGERWPAIMELAARDVLTQQGYDPDKGVPAEEAFKLVTGTPGQTMYLSQVPAGVENPPPDVPYNQLGATLTDALANGGPVIAGTTSGNGLPAPYDKLFELRNGMVNSHMYAVTGFDQESNQVTLRNPHGQGEYGMRPDGVNDGVFKMPLDEFYANFFNLVVPQK